MDSLKILVYNRIYITYKLTVRKKASGGGGGERLFSLSTSCPFDILSVFISVRLCLCYLFRERNKIYFSEEWYDTWLIIKLTQIFHICLELDHIFLPKKVLINYSKVFFLPWRSALWTRHFVQFFLTKTFCIQNRRYFSYKFNGTFQALPHK